MLANMCFGYDPGDYGHTSAPSFVLAFEEHSKNCGRRYREEIVSALNKASKQSTLGTLRQPKDSGDMVRSGDKRLIRYR